MVRSLFSALLRRSQRQRARVTPVAAPRFVPTMQSLEAREVPAVLTFTTEGPAPAAPGHHLGDMAISGGIDHSGKDAIYGISFVIKVSKPSPG